jgi:hypothetical protein
MALCPHNDQIRSSNQVPKVIIDNSSRESHLLATFRIFGGYYTSLTELQHDLRSLLHYVELGPSVGHDTGNHIGNHSYLINSLAVYRLVRLP